MRDFTLQLRDYAEVNRVDLMGIAPIERFDGVPKERHPSSIFPEARSVLVVGKRITRGVLRGVEEGTQFDLYPMYGRDWLNNRILAMATFRLGEFLEDNGWEAVPLPNLPLEVPALGIPVRPNQPPPNVMIDFEDAAVRAGLGEIGYCGVFLTPQFGPRQRIQMILTDAKLEPNPILEKAICSGSKDHAKFCPMGAIDVSCEKTTVICGKQMVVARVDFEKCKICKNGAYPNPYHVTGKPDRLAAICVRSCVEYLETNKAIESSFHNPFRKRAPWQVIEERKLL